MKAHEEFGSLEGQNSRVSFHEYRHQDFLCALRNGPEKYDFVST